MKIKKAITIEGELYTEKPTNNIYDNTKLIEEFTLVMQKKSKLSAAQRSAIVYIFHKKFTLIEE